MQLRLHDISFCELQQTFGSKLEDLDQSSTESARKNGCPDITKLQLFPVTVSSHLNMEQLFRPMKSVNSNLDAKVRLGITSGFMGRRVVLYQIFKELDRTIQTCYHFSLTNNCNNLLRFINWQLLQALLLFFPWVLMYLCL